MTHSSDSRFSIRDLSVTSSMEDFAVGPEGGRRLNVMVVVEKANSGFILRWPVRVLFGYCSVVEHDVMNLFHGDSTSGR